MHLDVAPEAWRPGRESCRRSGGKAGLPDFRLWAAAQVRTRVRMSLGAKSRRRRRPKAGAGGHLPPRAFATAPSQLPDAALSPVGRRTILLRRTAHVQAAESGRSGVRRKGTFGLEFQFDEDRK